MDTQGPPRFGGKIWLGLATLLAIGSMVAVIRPVRKLAPLPAPTTPRPDKRKLVNRLLNARQRAKRWLPGRALRARLAPLYRTVFLWVSGYRGAVADLVQQLVQSDDSVLDVGTGQGLIALAAARIAQRVDATDSSGQAIDKGWALAARSGRSVTFRQAPATALPYPDNHFSLVLSGLLLLALPRSWRQQVLQEIYRVLQPGGRIAFFIGPAELGAVPMPESQWQRFVARAGFVSVQVDHPQSLFPLLRARKPWPEKTV